MNKKLFVFAFAVLFLSIVSATQTPITIKTIPNHEVQIAIHNPSSEGFQLYDRFDVMSDIYGDVSVNYSSEVEDFKIIVFVKSYGETVLNKKYNQVFEAGEPVVLELYPDDYVPIVAPEISKVEEVNVSVNDSVEEVLLDVPVERKDKLTGFAVFDSGLFTSPTLYYILGGVVVVLVILVLFFKRGKREEVPQQRDIVIRKLSEVQAERAQEQAKEKSEALRAAEIRLRSLQEEVSKLRKDDDKIRETEARIRENQELLRKLKGEGAQ